MWTRKKPHGLRVFAIPMYKNRELTGNRFLGSYYREIPRLLHPKKRRSRFSGTPVRSGFRQKAPASLNGAFRSMRSAPTAGATRWPAAARKAALLDFSARLKAVPLQSALPLAKRSSTWTQHSRPPQQSKTGLCWIPDRRREGGSICPSRARDEKSHATYNHPNDRKTGARWGPR